MTSSTAVCHCTCLFLASPTPLPRTLVSLAPLIASCPQQLYHHSSLRRSHASPSRGRGYSPLSDMCTCGRWDRIVHDRHDFGEGDQSWRVGVDAQCAIRPTTTILHDPALMNPHVRRRPRPPSIEEHCGSGIGNRHLVRAIDRRPANCVGNVSAELGDFECGIGD